MADLDDFESGVAVAEAPEEEAASEEAADADIGFDMEWEVETEPAEEPAYETVTEETVVEEYYEPDRRKRYAPDYDTNYKQDYGYNGGSDRGYDYGYGRRNDGGFGQRGYGDRRVARRFNKHLYTWLLSFLLGIYGVDRMVRGQIGLGLVKMLTFGGFGIWYLCDLVIAIIQSYAGPYRNSDYLDFDQYGMFV